MKALLQRWLRSQLAVWLVVVGVAAAFWGGLGTWWLFGEFSSRGLRRTERVAQPLIAAIETFRKDCNRYPVVLEELLPGYITEITNPPTGTGQWEYSRTPDRRGFLLVVYHSDLWMWTHPMGDIWYGYVSTRKGWKMQEF